MERVCKAEQRKEWTGTHGYPTAGPWLGTGPPKRQEAAKDQAQDTALERPGDNHIRSRVETNHCVAVREIERDRVCACVCVCG